MRYTIQLETNIVSVGVLQLRITSLSKLLFEKQNGQQQLEDVKLRMRTARSHLATVTE